VAEKKGNMIDISICLVCLHWEFFVS